MNPTPTNRPSRSAWPRVALVLGLLAAIGIVVAKKSQTPRESPQQSTSAPQLATAFAPLQAQDAQAPHVDAVRVNAEGLPAELQTQIGAYLLRAETKLGTPEFGLKPPPRAQMWLRIRTPKPEEPILPSGLVYTAGTAAITLYASSASDVLDGSGSFDPVYSLLDGAVETSWATRLQVFWLMPNALRTAINRHFAEPLLESLQKEESADATAVRWPGKAKPRQGSLDSLPPNHPLVQDRDRIRALFDAFEKKPDASGSAQGRAALVRFLNEANHNALGGLKFTKAAEKLLEQPLLPDVEFDTKAPWKPDDMKGTHAARIDGVTGDSVLDACIMKVCYGEQRMSARDFQDLRAGGAPTLLLRCPLAGTWVIDGVEVRVRRTAGKVDDAAKRVVWAVVLDQNFHELYRWPFPQSVFPKDKDGWVVLPFAASPNLPLDFFFVALEAEDPGPDAKLEISVERDAIAEHSFRSIPGRKLSKLETPVDFGFYVKMTGRGEVRRTPARTLLLELASFCKNAAKLK